MSYKVVSYPLFDKAIKRLRKKYRSLGGDYKKLLDELKENHLTGADLGRGLRKVRMAIAAKGKGKSGGARVITLIVNYSKEEGEIGLLYIYDKSERESISDRELEEILRGNGLLDVGRKG